MEMNARLKAIKALRKSGKTLQEIGEIYGISRERVRQILAKKKAVKEIRFCLCGKKIWSKAKIFCKNHSIRLSKYGGSDRTRDVVRIRDGDKCQRCFRLWKKGERKFDVHHLNGLCGKKSMSVDLLKDMAGLLTLCHKCHLGLETNREKMSAGLKGRRRNLSKITYEELKEARALIDSGKSIRRTSRALGLTYVSLYRLLNK